MTSLLNSLKDFILGTYRYHSIKKLPKWAWVYYRKWERRLPTHPYNMICYIKGKHMVYKVVHGMGAQGEAPIIGIYARKRR